MRTFSPKRSDASEKNCGDLQLCTFQGVKGVLQLVHVAADALQSIFGSCFGKINSVLQLDEVLQRTTWM